MDTTAWTTTAALAALYDEHTADVPAVQRRTLQVLKLSEEVGEVAQALIGATNSNPRKGQSHTWDDVAAEVLDVLVTSMVTLHRLGVDNPEELFTDHLRKVADRAAAHTR